MKKINIKKFEINRIIKKSENRINALFILVVAIVLVVVVVAAFKIFFNNENVENLATKLEETLEKYYLKGSMELTNGEEVRNFNVQVGYEKEDGQVPSRLGKELPSITVV